MKTAEMTGAALDYWVAKALGLELCRREDLGLIPVHPSMKREVMCLTLADEARLDEMFGDAMRERTEDSYFRDWNPSIDWKQGGPIIERERIAVWKSKDGWAATMFEARAGYSGLGFIDVDTYDGAEGETPLIAATRAYVFSVFGEDVDATA